MKKVLVVALLLLPVSAFAYQGQPDTPVIEEDYCISHICSDPPVPPSETPEPVIEVPAQPEIESAPPEEAPPVVEESPVQEVSESEHRSGGGGGHVSRKTSLTHAQQEAILALLRAFEVDEQTLKIIKTYL